MFLRVVRAAGGNGIKHEYIRLVEAYRDKKGKTQHRTIVNLGRKDVLREHLDVEKLTRLLHGDGAPEAQGDDVGAIGAWDWGGMLVAQKMWSDLGLHATLDKATNVERTDAARLSDRVLVLVANRLMAPGSEHALARWLESDFVCDRRGRRFVAAWRKDDVRKASSTPRVRVEMRQLKQWYRTLDELLALKNDIEHALFLLLRDLFSLEVDLVFYDLTSTYFEGKGPPELAANGHSRDGKPRNVQVLVGMVMVDGWPIAHHVFQGNWRDAKTVPEVVRDLEQRFGLKRIVLVGDRGMATSQNLEQLKNGGHGYIVGRNRRRSGEVFDYIQHATGPWIECPAGITAREKSTSPKTLVQEVASNHPGVRVFVVHSDERLAFERAQRTKAQDRVRGKMEALQRRVASGKLKAPEKIGAAAAAILARNHGHRYYGWSFENGVFRFFEHPVHFTREQAYEGKYVIQTEEPNLSPVEAVRVYKELSEIERAFASSPNCVACAACAPPPSTSTWPRSPPPAASSSQNRAIASPTSDPSSQRANFPLPLPTRSTTFRKRKWEVAFADVPYARDTRKNGDKLHQWDSNSRI
ncbi:MAG TPA: IS1634 family transposase [Candidatus Sulfotelmatobacter sp.]|nr:IS1634 family transposase [Candidatus Sulfotelmatobacter sp.]